jgi:hypothetical protein
LEGARIMSKDLEVNVTLLNLDLLDKEIARAFFKHGFEKPITVASDLVSYPLRLIRSILPFMKHIIRTEAELERYKIMQEMNEHKTYSASSINKKDIYFPRKKRKSKVHPAFGDIIKQLSPIDHLLIKNGQYLEKYCPLIRIFVCEDVIEDKADFEMQEAGMLEFHTSNYKVPMFSHYSLPIVNLSQNKTARSISIFNLHRLGLINTGYNEKIIKPEGYLSLYKELTEYEAYKEMCEKSKQYNLRVCLTRGYTSPTEFGRLFNMAYFD